MKEFQTQLRVRYKETDQMQVVYYSNYLVWFEVARVELFRSIGIPYKELEKRGLYLMVVDAQCSYKSPARYDDLIAISCSASNIKNTSLSFTYKIYREKELLATGLTSHVFTDTKKRPVKIPAEIKEKLIKCQVS